MAADFAEAVVELLVELGVGHDGAADGAGRAAGAGAGAAGHEAALLHAPPELAREDWNGLGEVRGIGGAGHRWGAP